MKALLGMRIEPELSSAIIVLIGSFNPKIFQPFWFAKHDLIRDQAAESAEISVIHPEITAFQIESLFTLQVQRNRFEITRTVAPLILISDLAVRLFTHLLPHTPISQMGINRQVHFDVGDTQTRDRIGEMLAPRGPWGPWGAEVSSGTGRKHGGLVSLTLIQRNIPDRAAGSIQTKVEPSLRIRSGETGIFVEVNDHYELPDPEPPDATEMMKILEQNFDRSIRHSEEIIDQIMSLKS
jgi:hypothetical protein